MPLLEAASTMAKAVIAPLLYYIREPCCPNERHATNSGSPAFAGSLPAELAKTTRQLKELLNANGLRRHRVLNVSSTIMAMQLDQAWSDHTTVPTETALKALLKAINGEAKSIIKKM